MCENRKWKRQNKVVSPEENEKEKLFTAFGVSKDKSVLEGLSYNTKAVFLLNFGIQRSYEFWFSASFLEDVP